MIGIRTPKTKTIQLKPFDNRTVVREEELGHGQAFVVGHATAICDNELYERIKRLSVEHIIA